jgi:hypothetical protein
MAFNNYPSNDSFKNLQKFLKPSLFCHFNKRMNKEANEIIEFSQGDIYLWVEQKSSVMLKAITKSGDPVELNSNEVKELASVLINMAAQIE